MDQTDFAFFMVHTNKVAAQIWPHILTFGCRMESRSRQRWRVSNKLNTDRKNVKKKKQERESEWADGDCVKWRRRHIIKSQRTLLSGAPAGKVCGNTQTDSNSSCCGKEEVCLIHCCCASQILPACPEIWTNSLSNCAAATSAAVYYTRMKTAVIGLQEFEALRSGKILFKTKKSC